MTLDHLATVLWRRRLAFLLAFIACLGTVVAVTLLLPKSYRATATLYVVGETFDTTEVEQLTRTYATLAANPNVAEEIATELPAPMTRSALLRRMSFAPVERTPLLLLSAEGETPREAQLIANIYASSFVERIDARFADVNARTDVFVSEPAARPTAPVKPNVPLYLGFGGLLSLLLALGVALLRDRLDTRIRPSTEADAVLGQPILARVPRIEVQRGVSRETSDRFLLLKTNLDFVGESPWRTLMVSSSTTGEGKTTVATNLALACAADGEKVVIVEADLRKPALDEGILGQHLVRRGKGRKRRRERPSTGLSNYLAGAASEEDVVQRNPTFPGVGVIWAGLTPPNPTALLSSRRLDELLESLRNEYHRVIVDTSPVSVGADASVVAPRVDGVVFVLDEHFTKRADAQAGLNQLAKVQANVFGVVVNRADIDDVAGYYSRDGADGDGDVFPAEIESSRSETPS
ncbi:MAG: polysaccharide biosynthesis tyrosine autokinase [Actinobacteria bacterium]|nr:polysaccharide biosynthesis tyrosine autokinase [Actinomycetota bacterium]